MRHVQALFQWYEDQTGYATEAAASARLQLQQQQAAQAQEQAQAQAAKTPGRTRGQKKQAQPLQGGCMRAAVCWG